MKRRGHGEGSVYKRDDDRWEGKISLPNGRRRSFYGATRAAAVRRMNEALRALEGGQLPPPERQTLEGYLSGWLRTSVRGRVRPSTYEGYERMVRLHVNPALGHLRLTRLTPQLVSQLHVDLQEKGLAPKTITLVHNMLHKALSQAVLWGQMAVNPAAAVAPPRPVRKEVRPLTSAQAQRLLAAAVSDRLHALYTVALTCGLRQGELLGLRWQDMDLDAGVLAVRQQAQRELTAPGRREWVFTEPKTAKGRRTIALPQLAVDALLRHRQQQAEERLRVGQTWEDLDLVFPNLVGRPIEKSNLLRRSFWPLLERAGLPHMRFHDLRHTAATLLLTLGLHPKVVQERLGHSTIGVTMDVYSHVMPTLQKEAATKLDQLFNPNAATGS